MTDYQPPKPRPFRVAPSGVENAVRQGRKVIFIDGDIPKVPEGYILLPVRYRNELQRILLPRKLFFYIANRGEYDLGDALDELADAYDDIGAADDALMIEGGLPNAPRADLAIGIKDSYRTYLVNRLLRGSGESIDGFSGQALEDLMLDDVYVADRVKAIAALQLGKRPEELTAAQRKDLEGILVHKNEITSVVQDQVTRTKMKYVRCEAGSHWEYRHVPVTVTSTEDVTRRESHDDVRGKVSALEDDIVTYWRRHGKQPGRHDIALLREYANLAYIHKEHAAKDLEVTPPPRPTPDAGGPPGA
jgi:hypothetical protein